MKIAGKVAVVTGGSSGIGQAVVRAFIQKGGRAAIFDLNEVSGQAMVKELGPAAIFAKTNVSDEASVAAAIAKTMAAFGAIHVCVNCAGIGSAHKTFGKDGPFPLAEWDKTITVNLTGTFNVTRLCAEQMAKNPPEDANGGRGVVINTASVAAYDGQIGQAAYSASKGGVVGMTLPIARDLSAVGIRVNTIAPGLIDTPIYGQGEGAEAFKAKLKKDVLFPHRLGTSEEFATLAVELVTNSYMNAESIRIDGGIRMQPK